MPDLPKLLKGANGRLPLPSRWLGAFPESHIIGGPFRHAPTTMSGVCLLEEHAFETLRHHHMPIEDFSVPHDPQAVEREIKYVFECLLRNQDVWVGCMGGWGRTGLMLSLIAKAAGVPDPVEYVRQHYTPRAVETKQQYAYVTEFDIASIQRWLRWAAVRHLHHRLH
jgi:hypothetical protein